jgi:multidrug efflux system outer membrane protein
VPLVRFDRRLAASTSFELDFWGRLGRSVEAARGQLMSTRYARAVVAMTLASTTAQAYFSLRSVDAQLVTARSSLATREGFLKLAEGRVAAGVASDLDLNAARSARADAALALTELERQRRVIEHQLAQLCGQAGLRLAPGDLLSLPMPPLPPAGLPSSLLERRPDVRAAEQTLLAANARIGVAKAAMFPSISLTGIAGGQSKDFNNLMQLPARIWTLGFGISLPLFDAGRNAARVEQAEARQRQSVAGYQKAVEAAFRETADALSNVALASEAEKAWQERLDSARHSLRLSMLRYEAGYSSYLEVLDAQRTANDTELGFIRNRQSRLAFSVDLMKALGGGWTP